jgi:hypothetical protein
MNAEPWHKIISEGMFLAEESSDDYRTYPDLLAEHPRLTKEKIKLFL